MTLSTVDRVYCIRCRLGVRATFFERHPSSETCRRLTEIRRLEAAGYAPVVRSGSNSPYLRSCGIEIIRAPTGFASFNHEAALDPGDLVLQRYSSGKVKYSTAQPWTPAWAVHACAALMEAGYSPERRRKLLMGDRTELDSIVANERALRALKTIGR